MGKIAKFKGRYKSTKTKKTYGFRSFYEKRYMRCLDSDPRVVTWEYETIKIPYRLSTVDFTLGTKARTYTPDFIITHEDGSIVLVEIKGEHKRWAPVTLKKERLGQQYCALVSNATKLWSYKIMVLKEIVQYEREVKQRLEEQKT